MVTARRLTARPLTARPLTARRLGESAEGGAAFSITITGLTSGEARIGDHASIGYTIDPDNGTETVAWGTSAGDDTYGTGANPTDYTAGDEGRLWLTVTDGGDTVSRSAPIRYAPGTAPSIADGQAWTVDDTAVNIDAAASGANLTFTYSISGVPAGVSINSSTGAITGTPTAVDSGTATITATDQYGRTLTDTFTWANTLRTQATAADGLGPFEFAQDEAITPVAVSSDFTLNGNTLTYTISPALPTGLSMSSAGSITGTPTALSASASYTVTGQDEYGRETTSTFDLAVVEDTGFGDDFVLVMETTTSNETVTIPCRNSGTFNATIDWGDSSTSAITAWDDADLAHEYATAGQYTIRISGDFQNIFFNNGGDKSKLLKILNWGDTGFIRLDGAFFGCSNLTEASSNGNTNTSSVTNMSNMFRSCSGLTTLDVSGFNTSSVTSMFSMFIDCSSLTTLDVSGWNTSSVTNTVGMFFGCTNLTALDVSGWNTSSVINMGDMFRNCSSLTTLDVSGWNTSSVTENGFSRMFLNCSDLSTIAVGGFDMSSATELDIFSGGMLQGCTALTSVDIDGWDITSITSAVNFLSGSNNALTTAEYDAVLVAWEAQAYNNDVVIHFGDATYTASSAAATARAQLVTDGWTITDGGAV